MKKIVVFCFVIVFALTALAGCADIGLPQSNANRGSPPEVTPEASDEVSEKTEDTGGITLGAIRKAAEDSKLNVYDEHQLVFLSEVKDGFSVEITADSQTTVYAFIECETEDAADKNAKDIDNAGYNIAICSGRLLTCYAVDKKDGSIHDTLSSLLEGKTVDKKLYASSPSEPPEQAASQSSSETAAPVSSQPPSEIAAPAPSEMPIADDITGTWVSGAISGRYNAESGEFEDVSGMGLIYSFHDDGTYAQLIVFGSYIVTTGKYTVSDGLLSLTDRFSIESGDNGQTWSEREALPDASSHYTAGTDDSGKHLLLGQEGVTPPLEASVNAMKFTYPQKCSQARFGGYIAP